MATLRMIPDEQWQSLRNHGQFISGLELVTRLDAAMTEVDLGKMADDYSADEREPWHDRQAYRRAIRDILDRIKEGK